MLITAIMTIILQYTKIPKYTVDTLLYKIDFNYKKILSIY